jgi:segregation and condensation protein A
VAAPDELAPSGDGGDAPPEPIDDAVRVELSDFEGPLDLLLHLVKKHELDILNIPIAFITDRYLAYLASMRALNLDVAGEYLLMAATLAHLKSRELLPPSPEEEQALAEGEDGEEGDPRQELIRRLLEYQKYKEAASQLGDRPVLGRNVWPRGMAQGLVVGGADGAGADPTAAAPLEEVPVFRLIESLEKVLARARVKLTHEVVVDRISIGEKIAALVDRLERDGSFTFASCFSFVDDPEAVGLRHQIVITFLAILEMTRLRLLRLHQPATDGDIYLSRVEGEPAGPLGDGSPEVQE